MYISNNSSKNVFFQLFNLKESECLAEPAAAALLRPAPLTAGPGGTGPQAGSGSPARDAPVKSAPALVGVHARPAGLTGGPLPTCLAWMTSSLRTMALRGRLPLWPLAAARHQTRQVGFHQASKERLGRTQQARLLKSRVADLFAAYLRFPGRPGSTTRNRSM